MVKDGLRRLAGHLEDRYGIRVAGLTPLEPWAPEGVQRVDRHDGPAWVARVTPAQRPIEAVEGDAEILRFLEAHDFPAERCAHPEPVSTFGTRGVLVTEYIQGENARGDVSGAMVHTTGALLGRLHTLPAADGAVAREAGGWHHLSVAGGGRREDIAALLPLMDEAAAGLPADQMAAFKSVREELESLDDCADLPRALINVDFGGPNIVKSPDGPVVVDWTGSGRGPRVLSMGTLMAGGRDPRLVDAFVAGYRKHATPEPEELERLAGALRVFMLVLDCWGLVFRKTPPADVLRSIEGERELAETVAARAREAFAADVSVFAGWEDVAAPPPMEDQFQVLVRAVRDKTDDEIAAFAGAVGGYARLCQLVFQGMRVRLKPEDCTVGFVLGDAMGWEVKASGGDVIVAKRVAKRAPAIVRTTPPEFLRLITRNLDWDTATADGRVTIDGDPSEVERLFASARR